MAKIRVLIYQQDSRMGLTFVQTGALKTLRFLWYIFCPIYDKDNNKNIRLIFWGRRGVLTSFTVTSTKSSLADAVVAVDPILARATVFTGLIGTIVDV